MSNSVACIDYRNGKLLVAKRNQTGDMGGRWEFPGGKLEEGEDYIHAVKREMIEEFGCSCEVFEKLAEGTFVHRNKNYTVTAFRILLNGDGENNTYKLTEHTQIKWVKPEEILSLNFVDSDLGIFGQIKKSLGIE